MTQEELNTLLDIFAASAGDFIDFVEEHVPTSAKRDITLFAFAVSEAKFLGMIRSELAQGLEFPPTAEKIADTYEKKLKELQEDDEKKDPQ